MLCWICPDFPLAGQSTRGQHQGRPYPSKLVCDNKPIKTKRMQVPTLSVLCNRRSERMMVAQSRCRMHVACEELGGAESGEGTRQPQLTINMSTYQETTYTTICGENYSSTMRRSKSHRHVRSRSLVEIVRVTTLDCPHPLAELERRQRKQQYSQAHIEKTSQLFTAIILSSK